VCFGFNIVKMITNKILTSDRTKLQIVLYFAK